MENDKKQKHHKNHDIGSSQKRRGGGCVSEKSMISWTTSVGKDLQKEKKKKKRNHIPLGKAQQERMAKLCPSRH